MDKKALAKLKTQAKDLNKYLCDRFVSQVYPWEKPLGYSDTDETLRKIRRIWNKASKRLLRRRALFMQAK